MAVPYPGMSPEAFGGASQFCRLWNFSILRCGGFRLSNKIPTRNSADHDREFQCAGRLQRSPADPLADGVVVSPCGGMPCLLDKTLSGFRGVF